MHRVPIPRPAEPPTHGIDRELRTAILTWTEARGATATRLWDAYASAEGHGTIPGALTRVGQRYGQGSELHDRWMQAVSAAAAHLHQLRGALTIEPGTEDVNAALARSEFEALLLLPDEEFLRVLECAPELAEKHRASSWRATSTVIHRSVLDYAGPLFERRGLPWSAGKHEGIRWVGDQEHYSRTIAPALVALADPRLSGAKARYADALERRRQGDQAGRIATLNATRRAVEAALEALLRDRGLGVPGTVVKDIDQLVNAEVLDRFYQPMLEAAPRIANKLAAHEPSDGIEQHVPAEAVDAAIAAAGTAIVFLAARLLSDAGS